MPAAHSGRVSQRPQPPDARRTRGRTLTTNPGHVAIRSGPPNGIQGSWRREWDSNPRYAGRTTVFETARFGRSRIPPGGEATRTTAQSWTGQGSPGSRRSEKNSVRSTAQRSARTPACDGCLVVEPGIREQVVERSAGAGLRICGAEHEPADTGGDECPGAHRARLQRHDDGALRQAPTAEPGRGVAQGEELGVGGRVARAFALVVAFRDDDAVGDDHGTDRDIAVGPGEAGLGDRRTPSPPCRPRRTRRTGPSDLLVRAPN